MLASEHTQPDVEFKLLIKVTMLSEGLTSGDVIGTSDLARDRTLDPALVSKAWATLCALLHSSLALCQSHGYSWLLELLAAEMACGAGGSKQSSKLNTHMLQQQISVLGSLEWAAEMKASLKGSHPVNYFTICSVAVWTIEVEPTCNTAWICSCFRKASGAMSVAWVGIRKHSPSILGRGSD
jgi:hypothetical protein